MHDDRNTITQGEAATAASDLPECFGSGKYQRPLRGYSNAFTWWHRSPRECFGCALKPDCFEARRLWAAEARSR
jgi:hypothetical protein